MDEHDVELITAYHEAGHALMAVSLGGHIIHVSLEPPNDGGPNRYGESVVRWPTAKASDIDLAEIQVSLAGPIAEQVYSETLRPLSQVPEFAADWLLASELARKLVALPKVPSLLRRLDTEVREFFHDNRMWAATCAIADLLLAHETIEHDEVADCFEFWSQR